MELPPIAPYPPLKYRTDLVPEEWEACLDAWVSVSECYLRLTAKDFSRILQDERSVTPFLVSYYQGCSEDQDRKISTRSPKSNSLRKTCFLLSHRALLDVEQTPKRLLDWRFLSNLSHTHLKSPSLQALLERLWQTRRVSVEQALRQVKDSLIQGLEAASADDDLKTLTPLVYSSPEAGTFLMTGSDLIDGIWSAYPKVSAERQKHLASFTYLGLISLTQGGRPNNSTLFDHLYSLKSQADRAGGAPNLLGDLVTNTPLITKLQGIASGKDADRAHTLASSLASFRTAKVHRQRRHPPSKGKAVSKADAGDHHVYRMSRINQIHDLFPDLGSAFVARLLDYYSDDVEQVTAHLLDDSLPPDLQSLDRTAQLSDPSSTDPQTKIDHLAPRATPSPPPSSSTHNLPIRRNVFDNDEFDRLAVSKSNIHIGRRNAGATADSILRDSTDSSSKKAAILSALAAFDSDDDERDDTYDEADVGGTVDARVPDGEERGTVVRIGGRFAPQDSDANNTNTNTNTNTNDRSGAVAETELTLFREWKANPDSFSRSSETRRSDARRKLRETSGMTDEGIEGWAIMLARDPKKLRALERASTSAPGGSDGRQSLALGRTAYREGNGTDTEDTEASGVSDGGGPGGSSGRGRGGGRGRGRGRGAGRGRGGGNVAGAPGESGTQVARSRKEAGKGSRANHNRRDQRAKKMARGGFPG